MTEATHSTNNAIEAEEDPAFSDYAESTIESETQSLTSSVHEFFEQNGRRYHTYFGPEKNLMPNDAAEQKRLDVAHELCLQVTGTLCEAPVMGNQGVHRVLDLGTGTGIWAIDFAYENPHAEVIGMDLSPIQAGWVAPNCRFELDDFELEWNYRNAFDYIHARMVTQSVRDWPRLLKQAKDHLNPGGWIELAEVNLTVKCDDGTVPENWPPVILFKLINKAMKQSGATPVSSARELYSYAEKAGFKDLQVKTYKIPSGVWPKSERLRQAGRFSLLVVETGYEAYALALCTRVLGMPQEEVLELCKKAKEAHLDRKCHAYWDYYMVFGRKPIDDEETHP